MIQCAKKDFHIADKIIPADAFAAAGCKLQALAELFAIRYRSNYGVGSIEGNLARN